MPTAMSMERFWGRQMDVAPACAHPHHRESGAEGGGGHVPPYPSQPKDPDLLQTMRAPAISLPSFCQD